MKLTFLYSTAIVLATSAAAPSRHHHAAVNLHERQTDASDQFLPINIVPAAPSIPAADQPALSTAPSTPGPAFTGNSTTAPSQNGYLSDRPAGHVDTVKSSWGIPSIATVRAVRFSEFCKKQPLLCYAVRTQVDTCAGEDTDTPDGDVTGLCTEAQNQHLVALAVGHNPCKELSVVRADALTQKVCAFWEVEAKRCARATVRKCGGHHALYLLRQFAGYVQ